MNNLGESVADSKEETNKDFESTVNEEDVQLPKLLRNRKSKKKTIQK